MIKEEIIEYRNTHQEARVLLGVVLGEFERIELAIKNPINPITDVECVKVIKKLIASNNECNITGENEILELFLPQQLTEDKIKGILTINSFNSIGDCMKYFKVNHDGLYDGKQVSKLFSNK